ncbi:MAG: short-chain dehydrogenase [Alphaproteobacteria bacterium]|nr:MAG: short-chain dehydrogenase [Alphaproteobacteria bacterium]
MAIPRLRAYQGPAILSYGFRPFFFLAALFAGTSMLFWLPQYYGVLTLPTLFAPVDWHLHEILFGYLAAVLAGFLFTAVPNWTGRMPIQGNPLLFLVLLWIAGRLAVTFSVPLGWIVTMILDLAFLTAIVFVIAKEVISGQNWRNLKVLLPLVLFWIADIVFHLEVHFSGISDLSRRLGMATAIILIMLIGGRIIPSFTRNSLVRKSQGRLPIPFGKFDIFSILVSILALAGWVVVQEARWLGFFLLAAGILQFARLARWAGDRTSGDFLVAILHVSYFFVPAGLILLGLSNFIPEDVPAVAGTHALGAGAIGSMTLSVMIRATLGHTGQALKAGFGAKLILSSIWIAALARIVAALFPGQMASFLELASFAWTFAFLGFVIFFGGLLFAPRAG